MTVTPPTNAVSAIAGVALLLVAAACQPVVDGHGGYQAAAASADVVATVVVTGRDTAAGVDGFEFDTVLLRITDHTPLVADSPVGVPTLPDEIEALLFNDVPTDEELVAFLAVDDAEDASPPDVPWTLLFALDPDTGAPAGDFGDRTTRSMVTEIQDEAGAEQPSTRTEAVIEWVSGEAARDPRHQRVEDAATSYFGQAVRDDVAIDRATPFSVTDWLESPVTERHLPLGVNDPAEHGLRGALDLWTLAVAVRPNGASTTPVGEVALEFVGTGVLGWIPLRDVPTGLVGAAPATGQVRVLGRTAAGRSSPCRCSATASARPDRRTSSSCPPGVSASGPG
jgi:hypothetical protein